MQSYRITYSAGGHVAEVVLRGKFLPSTVMPVIVELRRYNSDGRLDGVLWDLREADLSDLTIAALRDIFRSKNALTPVKRLRIACLVATEGDAQILKLWAEGFDDDRPHHRRWFFDREEGLAWLTDRSPA